MSKEFPTIIIPCQGKPDMEIKEIFFSRTDLNAPKNSWGRPYSNPNGEDNKSLQWRTREKKGGDLSQDACSFSFDFDKDEAVFSFDPNKIQVREDKGRFDFELTGKYGFKEYVRFRWEKEKCSLIEVVQYIDGTSYTLGNDNTFIGYIVVSPMSKPCQPQIKVKISLDKVLHNYLNIEDEFILLNGEEKKIEISLKKESLKHLPKQLINGKISFRVDSTDGNEKSIEVTMGEARLLEESKGDNRVTLIEETCLSISNCNDDYELFDEENPITVYVNQEPKQIDINLNTTLTEANAIIEVCSDRKGSKILVTSEDFGKKIQLKKNDPNPVSVFISPNNKAGTIRQSLILSADYSMPCKKDVYVKSIEQNLPIAHLYFNFSSVDEDNNPNPYYKGNGKENIGILQVVNESSNNEQYRYITLPPTCTCPFVTIEPFEKSLKIVKANDKASYNVFIDIPESRALETDEDNNLQLVFSCDGLEDIRKTIPVQSKEPEPIDIKFHPEDRVVYSPDEKILAGYLAVTYTRKDSRRYVNRDNRIINVEAKATDILLIGEEKETIPLVDRLPVYYDCTRKFARKKNIDEKEHVEFVLLYSDSIENKREIPIEFDIHPIKAAPLPNVNVSSGRHLMIWENGSIKAEWTYQFDSRVRNVAQSAIIGTISFANKQIVPYKDSKLLFKNVVLEGKHLRVFHDPEFSIPNGSEPKEFSIQILYGGIPMADNFSTELHIKYEICLNDSTVTIEDAIPINIREEITDDWYSIDLGTTGIVVAKWNYESETGESDGISAIKLSDYEDEFAIERSRNIVSSITILKPSSNNDKLGEVIVAPSTPELKQNAKYVLVPTKFMVGQNVLPFFNIYKMTFPDGLLINGEIYNWEAKTTEDKVITPKEILTHTYKTIFSKISEDECKRIRKLIITYPNTYTPESLDWLRDMIINSGIFENLSSNNLHFIPESDSVVAYYVKKSMERETNTASERVVIYDMGAGTLDLSYVKISIEEENGRRFKKSAIEKRIGIPIAGEYFSYLIYEDLKEKFTNNDVNYTKKAWIDNLKIKYGSITKFNEVQGESLIKSEFANENISLGESINKWINICTEQALIKLLGNEWGDSVDRIVLSGRGSQFKPIQDKLKDLSETNGIILDLETITLSELKQCVAEGAILYQKIFENPSLPFSIVHRNSYEHIGIQYRVLVEDFTKKWTYKELMNESHLIWDLTPKDGAIFAQVPPIVIENLDFRLDEDIVFYLTSLTESDMLEVIKNPGSEKEVFMNELFRFKPSVLDGSGDRKECTLNLSIDSNNKLSISINSMDLLPHSTLPKVEDDKFYVKCNWYLN